MNRNIRNISNISSNIPPKNRLNVLSEDLTNMIDSNKTITRLSTVVKELIENSIDAGAENISVFIKDGGLSLIEVRDDGRGIEKENFNKLCQRFNSSKMSDYEELQNISTFGFRGEALSILSYISHLTILSRTQNSQFGFEATFKNGKILESNQGRDSNNNLNSINLKIVPCEVGTLVKIENIFYNNLIRKKYYDKNEEAKDIINLISKYAFHFFKINFGLSLNIYSNKIFSTNNNLLTGNEERSPLEFRKSLSAKLFNQEIHDNLYNFDNFSNTSSDNILDINLKSDIRFECFFTKPSAHLDKSTLIIFLNNRLILHNSIKKTIDQTYSKFLIKNGNYFAYLDIQCPSSQIDINVKANKSEVLFLDEEKFLMQLKVLLEKNLNEEINSKNYYTGEYSNFKKKDEILFSSQTDVNENYYAKDKVRVDTKTVPLEKFLSNIPKQTAKNNKDIKNDTKNEFSECLKLVYSELFDVKNRNILVNDIIKDNFYIGYESLNNLAFVQKKTSLYIINVRILLEEFILYSFLSQDKKNLKSVKIKSDYQISDILTFVFENFHQSEIENNISNFYKEMDLNSICGLIREKTYLLGELGIQIDENYQITEMIFFEFNEIFKNNDENFSKNNFLSYIPMIYYSIIELFYRDQNKGLTSTLNVTQTNQNLNIVLEIYKLLSHYLAMFYLEYLSKIPIEEANNFLRDVLFHEIKIGGFHIRKNIKEDIIIEKIVDTETLYTVFERC